MTNVQSAENLVAGYLDAVHRHTADLPAERRDELLTDLSTHIAVARAELDPETEAGVRQILDRLGDPATIAAEARLAPVGSAAAMPPTTMPPTKMPPTQTPPTHAPVPTKPPRSGWVVALIVAVVLIPVLAGVAVCALGAGLFVINQRVDTGTPDPITEIAPPSPSPS